MKSKRLIYFAASIILWNVSLLPARGQGANISFGAHYGTYAMNDPKAFQNELLVGRVVPLKAVATFPAYWGYDGQVYFNVNKKLSLGAFGGLNSTGGRVNYSDYSGSLTVDQPTQCLLFGVGIEYVLTRDPEKPSRFFISLRTGSILTKYKVSTTLEINGQATTQTLNFTSSSYLLSPGLGMNQKLSDSFFLKAEVRYLVDSEGELHDPDGLNLLLTSSKGTDPVYTDWSGIRLGLALGFKFGRGF